MRQWLQNLNQAAKEAAREMGNELKHMAAHGSHEVSAALFNGSAFVMYPRGTHDDGRQNDHAPIEHEREM